MTSYRSYSSYSPYDSNAFKAVFVLLPTTMNARLLSLALLLSLPGTASLSAAGALPVTVIHSPFADVQPMNEIAISAGYAHLNQFGDAPAFGASYSHFWTDEFSTRFGVFGAREDLGDTRGERSFDAYHASAEYHFLRDYPISTYAGAGLALAVTSIEGAEFDFSASETALTPMVSVGVNVNVSLRFVIGADLSYMYYDVELGSRFGYQVNPTTLLISAKYRY